MNFTLPVFVYAPTDHTFAAHHASLEHWAAAQQTGHPGSNKLLRDLVRILPTMPSGDAPARHGWTHTWFEATPGEVARATRTPVGVVRAHGQHLVNLDLLQVSLHSLDTDRLEWRLESRNYCDRVLAGKRPSRKH